MRAGERTQRKNSLLSSGLSDRASLSQAFELYQSSASDRDPSCRERLFPPETSVNEAKSLTAQDSELSGKTGRSLGFTEELFQPEIESPKTHCSSPGSWIERENY